MSEEGALRYRMMTAIDVGRVPIDHQGTPQDVLTRIADLGSSAAPVFDGDQGLVRGKRDTSESCPGPPWRVLLRATSQPRFPPTGPVL